MLKVIGHRGAAGHAPENTFAAFDHGLSMGVDGVETDIRTTRDGVLVLMHDASVDRTTDGSGAISDLAWEEVQRLNAAARFHDGQHRFGAQGVPSLAAFLDRYGARTTYRLEIKQRGVESASLRAVRARRLIEYVTFTSFQLEALAALRPAAPEAQLAYLARDCEDATIQNALRVGANEFAPRADTITPERVQAAQAVGLRVWAWGMREPELLHRAVAAGIGGCTLDYPDWADALRRSQDT